MIEKTPKNFLPLSRLVIAALFFALSGSSAPTAYSEEANQAFAPSPITFQTHARASAEQLQSSHDASSESYSLFFAEAQGSVFVTRFLSLHGDAKAYRLIDRGRSVSPEPRVHDAREAENLVAQLGNAAYHPVRVVAGKGYLPFGVNHQVLMESFKFSLSNRLTPPRQFYGNIVIDNLENRVLEVGGATDSPPKRDKEEQISDEHFAPSADGMFLRFSQDFPELYATRAIISTRGSRSGARVLNLALVNESFKEEVTAIEYQRSRINPIPEEDADEVSIRVTHQGAWVQDTRIAAFLEDLSSIYRTGIIQGDWRVIEHAFFHIGFGYLKSESDSINSRWFIATGMEGSF